MSEHSPEWRAHHTHNRNAPVDVFEVYRILIDTDQWRSVQDIGLAIFHHRTDQYDDNLWPTERSTCYHEEISEVLEYLVGIGRVEVSPHGYGFRWILTCFDCAYRYGQGFICKYGRPMGIERGCCRRTHPDSTRVLKGRALERDIEALRHWAERSREQPRPRLVEVDA